MGKDIVEFKDKLKSIQNAGLYSLFKWPLFIIDVQKLIVNTQ